MTKTGFAIFASAVFAVACATGGGQSSTDSAQSAEPMVDGADGFVAGSGSAALDDVVVEQRDGVTIVRLMGARNVGFSTQETGDELALAVDLDGVSVNGPIGPVSVYDQRVEQVSVTSHEETGSARVEVSLVESAAHEVVPTEEGLEVRIWRHGDTSWMTAASEAAEETVDETGAWGDFDVDAAYAEVEDAGGDALDFAGESAFGASGPPSASVLSRVSFERVEGGDLLHLEANGVIEAAEAFVLDDPPRLVLDLPGLATEVHPANVDVASQLVSQLRIGAHDQKVRVVIDGTNEATGFEGRRLMPVPTGLLVTLGTGTAIDDLLTARVDAAELAWEESYAVSSAPASEVETFAAAAPTADDGWFEDAAVEETVEAVEAVEVVEAVEAVETVVATDGWEDEMVVEPVAEFATEPMDEFVAETVAEVAYEPYEPVVDAVVPAAPAPAAAPAHGAISVTGINYESDAGSDRIAIVMDGSVQWSTYRPDAETFMLRIPNSRLVEGAGGRVAPSPGSGLKSITSFQQPEMSPDEVRLVVKHPSGVQGRVSAVGSMLLVEFPTAGTPSVASGHDPTLPSMPTQTVASASQVYDVLSADAMSNLPVGAPVGAAAPGSLEPPASIEILQEGGLIDGKDYQGRRISLDFKDVEIADVLRLIAEVSDLNVIAGDEVKGEVTIRLVDVPWDQALDVILLTKGLGFVRVGNVLRIAPADILAQEEEARLQERRAKEKLEDLVVKLIPVNYADVKEMESLTKRLLSSRGTVNTDERTSTLIVKDIPSVIDETSALVKAVDTETPQVMIEAKLVEANLDFSRELGTVWGLSTNQFIDAFDDSSEPRRDLGGEDYKFIDQNSVSFFNNITSLPNGLLDLSALILNEKFNIDLQLQAAESAGNGKVISSPRVVTLDNTEAEVIQGVSIPFQTFENGDAKLEFVDAVLSLKVQPHITADKSIIMKIEVTRDAPDQTVSTPTGSPAISKNQAKTETLVRDGQTLVLGGIYTIDKSYRSTRVPYLHSIPIIGAAFKSKEVSDVRKELLMFVTPRIVIQPPAQG